MADGLQEPTPKRWPALLVLAGISGLLPIPAVQRAHELAEELAWTLRGLVQPAFRQAAASAAPPTPPSVDPRVAELLSTLRGRVQPPRSRGWQRDGRFGVVPLASGREPGELLLRSPAAVPPGEPAFHGEQLIGYTVARSDGTVRLEPLHLRGRRQIACAGVPGRREARFLALGDGSATLRVDLLDGDVELREGDLAWAIDPPGPPRTRASAIARVVDGAWLGRLVRGELPEGAEREEWRVEPLVDPALLAEVAIRYPPGFPLPDSSDLYPFRSELSGAAVVDGRRAFARLCDGREAGIVPGSAVAIDGYLVGRVTRSGFGHALVRTLGDRGFRQRALALIDGTVAAFELEVVARDGARIEVRAPALVDWNGALVVTAGSADGTPEGLLIGALSAEEGHCHLIATREPSGAAVAWRPAGSWSAAP